MKTDLVNQSSIGFIRINFGKFSSIRIDFIHGALNNRISEINKNYTNLNNLNL